MYLSNNVLSYKIIFRRSTTPNSQQAQHDPPPAAIQLTPRHVQTNRSLTPTNQRSLTPTTVLSSSGTEQSGLSTTSSTAEDRSETTPPRLRQSAQNLHAIGQPHTVTPNLQAVTPQPVTPSGSKSVQRAASLPATPAEPVARGVANIGEGVRIEAAERNAGAGKRVKYSQSERVPNRLVLI